MRAQWAPCVTSSGEQEHADARAPRDRRRRDRPPRLLLASWTRIGRRVDSAPSIEMTHANLVGSVKRIPSTANAKHATCSSPSTSMRRAAERELAAERLDRLRLAVLADAHADGVRLAVLGLEAQLEAVGRRWCR